MTRRQVRCWLCRRAVPLGAAVAMVPALSAVLHQACERATGDVAATLRAAGFTPTAGRWGDWRRGGKAPAGLAFPAVARLSAAQVAARLRDGA